MNGVQTRFKCKLDVKRCKRFVFPPSSLLPRSNALKTKAIRYFQTDRTLTRIVSPPLYIIDKKTLHGSYFRLYNDFLGTKKMQIWPSFGHGYYVANMEPAQLKETLEKEITRKDIPAEAKKRAQTLINSLDEEGNNVILLAKMKK